MDTNQSNIKKILLKGLSAFFVFWLSGVLVFAGCGSHFFKVLAASLANDEEESCPLKGHDCCGKKHTVEDNSTNVSEDDSKTIDCCVFKPVKTLSADLSNSKNLKQSQVTAKSIRAPKAVRFAKETYKNPRIFCSVIRNRGSTYLQNCNFRI